jgi:hypothetical protein
MPSDPSQLPAQYYDFGGYVDRQRWLTYFHQLQLLTSTSRGNLLEIGVGPGIVRAVLASREWSITTVDVNASLMPDYVADLRSLPNEIVRQRWDWVLCSRVLHHIPLAELDETLRTMSRLDADRHLITVPQEDLSVQLHIRRTAGRDRAFRVSGGARLKRLLRGRVIRSAPSGRWMLEGEGGLRRSELRALLTKHFFVEQEYALPDDPAHVFFVVRGRHQ